MSNEIIDLMVWCRDKYKIHIYVNYFVALIIVFYYIIHNWLYDHYESNVNLFLIDTMAWWILPLAYTA